MLAHWLSTSFKREWCRKNWKQFKQATSRCARISWALKTSRPVLNPKRKMPTFRILKRSRDSSKIKIEFSSKPSQWSKISTRKSPRSTNVKSRKWMTQSRGKPKKLRSKSADASVTSKVSAATCKTWSARSTSTKSISWSWRCSLKKTNRMAQETTWKTCTTKSKKRPQRWSSRLNNQPTLWAAINRSNPTNPVCELNITYYIKIISLRSPNDL